MTKDNEDALRCAALLKTRNDSPSGFGLGPVCDEAAAHLRRLVAENEAKDALLRQAVEEILKLVSDDAFAMSFQTMGQYRSALIKAIRQHLEGKA